MRGQKYIISVCLFTCWVKLMFEGDGGFLILGFLVSGVLVENAWGPRET